MRANFIPTRQHVRALLVSVALVASPAAPAALPCSDPASKVPALGEYVVPTRRNAPAIVRVDQNDLDIRVIVESGKQITRFDGPGGRNGPEWIYLSSDAPTQHRLCFFPVYRQGSAANYRVATLPSEQLSVPEREAMRLLGEAAALWASDRLDERIKAIETYEVVARRGIERFDASNYAALYGALARTQRYESERALPVLEKLLANPQLPADIRYNAQWANGFILMRAGDLTRGQALLEGAVATAGAFETASKRSVRRDIAEITNLLGELRLTTGDLAEGKRLLEQCLELARDDDQLLAWIHNNFGYLHLRQADLGLAAARSQHLANSIDAHVKARDFAMRAGDNFELSHILNNLGWGLERVGDLRSARRYFESALQLIDETDDPYHFKMLYRGLGNIYLTLGDYSKAERFFEGSIAIVGSAFEDNDIRMHCRLGIVKRLLNKLSEAIAAHDACRLRAVNRSNPTIDADALVELSIDYALQNAQARAEESIAQAASLLPRITDRDTRSKIMTQQAVLLQRRGEKVAARERIGQAIETAAFASLATTRIEALSTATSIYREQGLSKDSRSFALLAINAIESVHTHLDSERLGPAWSARTHAVYTRLAADLLMEGTEARGAEAFDIIERSRAVSLRQQFSAPETRVRAVADDPTLAALSDLANRSAGSTGDAGQLPLAYYHEHDLLTLSRLSGIGDLPVPQPLPIRTLQHQLSDRQLALSYFFSDRSLYAFVIGPRIFEVHDLGDAASIVKLVDAARTAVVRLDKNASTALRELSRRLLPRFPVATATELIVVREGVLNLVPFGALHVGETDAYQPAAQRYLIRTTPSLSAFFMEKRVAPRTYSADLAIFADPMFRRSNGDSTGAAAPRARDGWTDKLARLPWTAQEAKRLGSLFSPTRTLIYTGEAATRQNLRGDRALNSRILHIASHGYFESENPENIGFALTPTPIDSGFVTLTELFSYPFHNELVVISGCDTALGAEHGGEGPVSLTRGFIAQGASHVVSTLWAVSDQASAEFMAHFYGHLVAGKPVAQSLSLAQTDLRKNPFFREPYFWAAYVLTSVAPDDRLLPAARRQEGLPSTQRMR